MQPETVPVWDGYLPAVGDIVEARRTPVDRFVKAVVLWVSVRYSGRLRVHVQWLEDDPDAGVNGMSATGGRAVIRAGDKGYVVGPSWPVLVRPARRDGPA